MKVVQHCQFNSHKAHAEVSLKSNQLKWLRQWMCIKQTCQWHPCKLLVVLRRLFVWHVKFLQWESAFLVLSMYYLTYGRQRVANKRVGNCWQVTAMYHRLCWQICGKKRKRVQRRWKKEWECC